LGYSGGDVYELLTFVGIVSGLGLDVQAVCGGYTHGWWFLWFSTSWLTTLCKRGTRFSRCLLQVQFLGRVGLLVSGIGGAMNFCGLRWKVRVWGIFGRLELGVVCL
jgi:hypothetical protein